jgi:hypothetical protein
MPLPPETINLTPASPPGAPATITLSPASAPAAPGTIALVPIASGTLVSTGTQNDILFTAVAPGVSGNSISITTSNSASLFVSVVGSAITIDLDTGITTASDVIEAVNEHVDASALVSSENAPGNDGSGVVEPSVTVTLSGGGSSPAAPSTITLTPASAPGGPSTITLTPASQPAAPGIITPS